MNIKNLHIPIILVSIIVSVISSFGSFGDVIGFLTFLKPESTFNSYIGFISFGETFFVQNEWWRLVTPMLIHFSFAHLAFNCLWIYILGSKIELINGRMKFLLLVLLTSIGANLTQYFFTESALFGGLSGVVYGLLGYCMIIEFEQKSEIYGLPPAIYMFMIVWMFLGFTGILTIFGFGEIANYAHLGGLIFGIFFAIMSLYFSKEINL